MRRIALINTGVSTERPLDELAAELGDLLVLHMRTLGQAAEALIENKEGGHADERETSVMLALDPRAVRMDKLAARRAVRGDRRDRRSHACHGLQGRAAAGRADRRPGGRAEEALARSRLAPLEVDASRPPAGQQVAAQAVEAELGGADPHPVAAADQPGRAGNGAFRVGDLDGDRGAEVRPVRPLVELRGDG